MGSPLPIRPPGPPGPGGPQAGGMPPMGPGGGGPATPPPGMPPMSGLPGGDQPPGAQAGPNGIPPQAQIVKMVRDLDQALQMLSQVFGPAGGEFVDQARQLLQQATSTFVAKTGGASPTQNAPAVSPTETGGSNFPGGY